MAKRRTKDKDGSWNFKKKKQKYEIDDFGFFDSEFLSEIPISSIFKKHHFVLRKDDALVKTFRQFVIFEHVLHFWKFSALGQVQFFSTFTHSQNATAVLKLRKISKKTDNIQDMNNDYVFWYYVLNCIKRNEIIHDRINGIIENINHAECNNTISIQGWEENWRFETCMINFSEEFS